MLSKVSKLGLGVVMGDLFRVWPASGARCHMCAVALLREMWLAKLV